MLRLKLLLQDSSLVLSDSFYSWAPLAPDSWHEECWRQAAERQVENGSRAHGVLWH
jgi:hypothetical protein